MGLPAHNLTIQFQHPEASKPLIVPLDLVCNTGDEVLYRNIESNARLPREWVAWRDPHTLTAILCGGGPSLADCIEEIRAHEAQGHLIFALNGVAEYLRDHDILADYQVILDPRPQTADLIGPAIEHLFASQCDPEVFRRVPSAKVWHLEIADIEAHFPPQRVHDGGYVLIGGAASVGVTALCLAYALGFRTMHCYGYDSSRRDNRQHAYAQPMNDGEPLCTTTFAGREYETSLTMKLQAERFIGVARALNDEGCDIQVHGSGLLPDMYRAAPAEITEQEKYERLWAYREYRQVAPGEAVTDLFLKIAEPDGTIIDFGCGTGRPALKLAAAGHDVLLVDFCDNSRDLEALRLPFMQHDLTQRLPVWAPYGFCTDVMEHIPPADVDTVLTNIFTAARDVFFLISMTDDLCRVLIGQPLHLSVHPYAWWEEKMRQYGRIAWAMATPANALFYVRSHQ